MDRSTRSLGGWWLAGLGLALACARGGESVEPDEDVVAVASAEQSVPEVATPAEPVSPEPAPPEPVPAVTTAIDPSVFHWAHDSDEWEFIDVTLRREPGEDRIWYRLAQEHADDSRPLADVGLPRRFAKGDVWWVFAPDGLFEAKVRELWLAVLDEDSADLRLTLGPGSEGLAVLRRVWKDREVPKARYADPLPEDDPKLVPVLGTLRRSLGAQGGLEVARFLEPRRIGSQDARIYEGRFPCGEYLVALGNHHTAGQSVGGLVIVSLDGRITAVVPPSLVPHGATTRPEHLIDVDGDGYDEAVVWVQDEGMMLLHWVEGRARLQPLEYEDA